MASSGIIPRLPPGILSIYGVPSIYGFGHGPTTTFGVIYDMSIANSGRYSIGQNVLIPYREAHMISYAMQEYWLIDESKIILIEQQEEGDIS